MLFRMRFWILCNASNAVIFCSLRSTKGLDSIIDEIRMDLTRTYQDSSRSDTPAHFSEDNDPNRSSTSARPASEDASNIADPQPIQQSVENSDESNNPGESSDEKECVINMFKKIREKENRGVHSVRVK